MEEKTTQNNNIITTDSIKSTSDNIDLPQPKTYEPRATPSLTDLYSLNKGEEKAQAIANSASSIDDYLKSMDFLSGEAQDLQTAKTEYGVQEKQQELQATNARILAIDAELQKDEIKLAQKLRQEERRDTLMPFAQIGQAKIAGDAAIYKALKTAEKNTLISQAVAKQGDIELAQQFAQDAVDAKYAPYKQFIENYTNTLEVLKPLLSSAETKQLKKQELIASQKLTEIEEQKADQKISQGFILNAIQGKAPQNIVDQAREIVAKGGTSTDIAETLGEYSLSGAERLDLAFKNMEMKRLSNEIALGSIEGFDGLPMTEEEADVMVSGIESVKALMNNKKLAKSSGGLLDRGWFVGADRAEWLADVTSMINSLTLDTFIEAKAKGATFGAMSEGEWEILKASATPLAEKMVKFKFGAKKGKVKRFTGTDEGLKADIGKIYEAQKQNYEARTGTPYPEVTENNITVDGDGNLIIDGIEESNEMFWGNLETIKNQ